MKALNHLSIKFRLTLMVLIVVMFTGYFIQVEISKSQQRIATLVQLQSNLKVYDEFDSFVNVVHRARLAKLVHQHEHQFDSLANSDNEAHEHGHIETQDHHTSEVVIEDEHHDDHNAMHDEATTESAHHDDHDVIHDDEATAESAHNDDHDAIHDDEATAESEHHDDHDAIHDDEATAESEHHDDHDAIHDDEATAESEHHDDHEGHDSESMLSGNILQDILRPLDRILNEQNKLQSSHNIIDMSLIPIIESLKSVVNAYDSVDSNSESYHWSQDVVSAIELSFFHLEKSDLSAGDLGIQNQVQVLRQLQWMKLWANEQNFRIHLDLDERSDIYHQDLQTLNALQASLLNRILIVNADAVQIEEIRSRLSSPDYLKSDAFIIAVLNDRSDLIASGRVDEGLASLDGRVLLIQELVEQVTDSTIVDIEKGIQQLKQEQMVFIGVCLIISMVMLLLALNILHRIISSLSSVVKNLSYIEEEQDYTRQLVFTGSDEFFNFSEKINNLVSSRHHHNQLLIESKEEAERANVAKSSFLANMSHEIRTPLNGIIGMSGILSETQLTPSQLDYLNTIETSSQTLLILINDILDLSKIESGNLNVSNYSTNLREIVYDSMSIIIAKASEKNVDLKVVIHPQLPQRLLLDDHRIRQILMNLISNAVKFTEKGQIALEVAIQEISDKHCRITLSVEDSGIGIAKDKQAAIFEPFKQEDGSTTRNFGGTGLGLAISTQLVELMGGKIEIDSEKGRGSRFFFSLDAEIEPFKVKPHKDLDKKNILLIRNNYTQLSGLLSSLDTIDIAMQQVGQIQQISQSIAAPEIIIYCRSELEQTKIDIDTLHKQFPNAPVVLCQSHLDSGYDFSDTVAGLVTSPLFGNRLIKSLADAFKTHSRMALSRQEQDNPNFGRRKSDAGKSVDVLQHATVSKRVLIVEDNLVNQKVATLFLKKAGLEVEIANNGQEAVEFFERGEKFSLVLMDCMMPILDGFGATKAIRALEKEQQLAATPIVALTASVLDEDINLCYDAGMDNYIAKPFKKESLHDILQTYTQDD